MFLAIPQGSVWIPLVALTGVVSIFDLGGMLCTVLAQFLLLLAGTSSQGLARDWIV